MPPKIEAAKAATFTTDDKRAQYARLVVFNHGVKEKLISKDKDVNTVSQGDLQKAFKSLTGGTLLQGKDGIELITTLSKKGASDPKVADRGLTTAYAQEVRPFLMRGQLSESFARRGRKAGEPRPASSGSKKTSSVSSRRKTSSTRSGAKKTSSSSRKKTSSRSSGRKTQSAPAPAEAAAVEGDAASA